MRSHFILKGRKKPVRISLAKSCRILYPLCLSLIVYRDQTRARVRICDIGRGSIVLLSNSKNRAKSTSWMTLARPASGQYSYKQRKNLCSPRLPPELWVSGQLNVWPCPLFHGLAITRVWYICFSSASHFSASALAKAGQVLYGGRETPACSHSSMIA